MPDTRGFVERLFAVPSPRSSRHGTPGGEDGVQHELERSTAAGMLSANDLCWWIEEPVLWRSESVADIAKAA